MSLWEWRELSAALDPLTSDKTETFSGISGISIDSRTCAKGDMFIALSGDPGPRFNSDVTDALDGHQFLQSAIDHGAQALLISKPPGVENQTSYLQVDDTLDGLWQLGQYARKRMQGRVAAITGSAGKTTARGWLEQILKAQAVTHASTGSLNNHWGVPLSLCRMPADADFAVFEVGTSHPGEIAPLAELISPHVAMVLNVLPAHIGNFDNLDAIRREKLSIVQALEDDGNLILPYGLQYEPAGWQGRPTRFGLDSRADVSAEATYLAGETIVEANVLGESVRYTLGASGEHRVLTSLAVLAAVYHLGADLRLAADCMASLSPPAGRGNEVIAGGIRIIDDSYNANPVSMSYALDALSQSNYSGRTIACLGEMLELGDTADKSHSDIIKKASGADCVFTVGKGFSACPGNWGHLNEVEQLDADVFAEKLRPGDTLLVKGSNKVFWLQGFVGKLVEILENR